MIYIVSDGALNSTHSLLKSMQ